MISSENAGTPPVECIVAYNVEQGTGQRALVYDTKGQTVSFAPADRVIIEGCQSGMREVSSVYLHRNVFLPLGQSLARGALEAEGLLTERSRYDTTIGAAWCCKIDRKTIPDALTLTGVSRVTVMTPDQLPDTPIAPEEAFGHMSNALTSLRQKVLKTFGLDLIQEIGPMTLSVQDLVRSGLPASLIRPQSMNPLKEE
jgi:hypothetical protein